MGRYSFLRPFVGPDGAPPTARQLYKAFLLLGSDFGYFEEQDSVVAFLARCRRRWGDLSPDTLLAVARRFAPGQPRFEVAAEGQDDIAYYGPDTSEEEDICFALAVLAELCAPESPPILLAYLASPYARERWLAAIGLAAMRDERVLPALEQVLVEFVGPFQPRTPKTGSRIHFQVMRYHLLRLLPDWGDPRAAPSIRTGLIANARAEEVEVPEPSGPEQAFLFGEERFTGQEAWKWFYNEQLFWADEEHLFVYALGRMGAFGALEDVPARRGIYSWQDAWIDDGKGGVQHDRQVPESHAATFRANVWRVHMCFGALESRFCGRMGTIYDFADAPELAEAVERLLTGKFGMDEAARRRAMEDYDKASWTYWTIIKYGWEIERARERAIWQGDYEEDDGQEEEEEGPEDTSTISLEAREAQDFGWEAE